MVTRTTVQTVGSYQSSNDWPWGVTKRRLKIVITATTTRSDREVYIQPPPPPPTHTNIRYMKRIIYTCVISLHWFYNLKTSCNDFDIGDVVTSTTPMDILKKQLYQFYYQRDESSVPSGRIYFDWRICTSSKVDMQKSFDRNRIEWSFHLFRRGPLAKRLYFISKRGFYLKKNAKSINFFSKGWCGKWLFLSKKMMSIVSLNEN